MVSLWFRYEVHVRQTKGWACLRMIMIRLIHVLEESNTVSYM